MSTATKQPPSQRVVRLASARPVASPRPAAPSTDALWQSYSKDRSKAHFDALVTCYRPYVCSVAERLSKRLPPSVDVDDLISAGSFGLMDAVSAFDLARGIKFQTFALKRIVGAMNDSLRAQDIAPRLARRREALVKRVTDDFRKLHGRGPTDEELLPLLHSDEVEAMAIIEGSSVPSMGAIGGAASDGDECERALSEPAARVPDHRSPSPATTFAGATEEDFQRWLGRGLSRSEKLILVLYYFESLTMRDIGIVLGICEGRVSQIHALLLERLRARMVREQEGERK